MILSISLVLFLAALPLVSYGSTQVGFVLVWLGLVAIAAAAALPPVARLAGWGATDEEGSE
jgi:hypothetical protein